ncbi:CopG family transcriptional regulator [Motilimonas pumila]|uniref:CopG family transcriptional regulator n=2 Tax=Motilimonas pumila TaxID=2303987 RepID=A0A418YED3_9GAMM|nr:CopG family transcriptional regulator [Motilimonas pumila]
MLARLLLAASLSVTATSVIAANMEMHKSAQCGCCTEWGDIMAEKGHNVSVIEQQNMTQIKQQVGLLPGLQSCHTVKVSNATGHEYIIEGHVPEADILKLLAQQPESVVGLAAPGMPRFSPGMAQPGEPYQGFDVIAWDKTGKQWVFSQY